MAPKRIVLLISQKLDESVDSFLYRVGTLGGEPSRPPNPRIAPIVGNVWFASHLSVSLVDADAWENADLSLLETFKAARRWEHGGWVSSGSSISGTSNGGSSNVGRAGRCEQWNEKSVESIQAIQKLGEVERTDDDISHQVFDPLFKDWEYYPVWWNCQEFAIRLAYLLLKANKEACETLVRLAREFWQQIIERITDARDRNMGLFTRLKAQDVFDRRRFDWWLTNMWKLQMSIPDLEPFHEELYDGWRWMEERRQKYFTNTRYVPGYSHGDVPAIFRGFPLLLLFRK
ncbi:hypothetical protein MGU_11349 [Metarhizium guizhouense ARSEF 977]|uniref:Uncharacterized protein n=1 Tax=Metarhizium guizhouense (strain ARSEF 977) TaxID=1276136 RepID=A0A0B4GFM8_METGA|nr:hypothetical protein MGU_11349 [Metarhizium guizhouense ARSEF 977]